MKHVPTDNVISSLVERRRAFSRAGVEARDLVLAFLEAQNAAGKQSTFLFAVNAMKDINPVLRSIPYPVER